jgi:hypothetical protein
MKRYFKKYYASQYQPTPAPTKKFGKAMPTICFLKKKIINNNN